MNVETGWERQVNNKNSGWGSNTTSNTNSGCGTNITSNEGSSCTQLPSLRVTSLTTI